MPTTDPRIDVYIAKAAEFAKPILEHFRATVHAAVPEVEETIKWSFPHFTVEGGILCSMAAFKEHCAFGFWHSAAVFGDTPRSDEAMGQFGRVRSVKDLPAKKELIALVRKAAKLREEGVKPKPRAARKPKPPAEVPDDLRAALGKNRKARTTFDAFSPSNRREYIDWITEAKTEETRRRRLDQAIEWMAEGKPRNWKYMK